MKLVVVIKRRSEAHLGLMLFWFALLCFGIYAAWDLEEALKDPGPKAIKINARK